MTSIEEIKKWLDALLPGSKVAIHDDGLQLIEVHDGHPTGAWLEIGGVPDDE
jgi:hypothetical protein